MLSKVARTVPARARLATSASKLGDGQNKPQAKTTARTGRVAEKRGQTMEEKYFRDEEAQKLRDLKEKQKHEEEIEGEKKPEEQQPAKKKEEPSCSIL